MWLLITFVIVWALSPGPIMVMTMHKTRKYGLMAGVAVAGGASLTATLMVLCAMFIQSTGLSAIVETNLMVLVERIGASIIVSMGLFAGYRSLANNANKKTFGNANAQTHAGFLQGMMIMGTYFPQALMYYNLLVPQSIDTDAITIAIAGLGALKVLLIFGWHSGIAFITVHTENWALDNRFGQVLEVATACIMVGLGVNVLI